jgi:hypothetical protein
MGCFFASISFEEKYNTEGERTMKKLFAAMAAFVLLVIIACGSSGGGSSSNVIEKSGLQGTWGNGVSSVTFMSDNTYAVDTNKSGTADAWGYLFHRW